MMLDYLRYQERLLQGAYSSLVLTNEAHSLDRLLQRLGSAEQWIRWSLCRA